MKRENEVLLQRQKAAGQTVPYRVIENPLKLSPDDWYYFFAYTMYYYALMMQGPRGGRVCAGPGLAV